MLRRAFANPSWSTIHPGRAHAAAVLALALGSLLLQVAPAGAVVRNAPHRIRARAGSNTEMIITGWSPGQSVTGFIADRTNPFDPVRDGYPASDPTTGFTAKDEGFAGVIHGTPVAGGPNLDLYCIDIGTETTTGIGYALGTWDASNVQNVGYVAWLLNKYYPHTAEPATLADGSPASPDQRAAAVQAAIWFFSDRYVLRTDNVLHDTVVEIVNRARAHGPLIEPPPPSLTISPASVSGARRTLGPFTVLTDAAEAIVNANGADMFSDRAGTNPIAPGAAVPSGTAIWLRSPAHSSALLQATSEATVPTGNVYLYDGNSNLSDAQRLILAETATLRTTVGATAEFLLGGRLVVRKTIAGAAAGSQGRVVIHVDCDDGVSRRDFVIPAGTPAGTTSRTYRHIPAGTTCTVVETANGSVVGTDVAVTGDGQQVTIPAGRRKTVRVTDTYTAVPSPAPSSLLVTKTIAGPLAGHQGPVTIQVICNGTVLPTFVIPSGTLPGSYSQSFGPVPAGSACTVSETTDGATANIAAIVSGGAQSVVVPAGEVVPVSVMDVYEAGPSPAPDLPTGTLRVTKTIAGPAGSQHGRIAILVACGGSTHTYSFVIPAHAGSGSVSRNFPAIPAGSRCTVTETANGHTGTVRAVSRGGHRTVTIRPNRTSIVRLTDTFVGVSAVSFTG